MKLNIKLIENIGVIFYLLFILMLIPRPLFLANFWLSNDTFVEITSDWKDYDCGVRFDAEFCDLNETFPSEKSGGKYINHNCRNVQSVAIVVPFRNRDEHLKKFLDYMHHYLLAQNAITYQIFVVEQTDNEPFNRGALLNVGYKIASELDRDITCFIFHDIDILPLDYRQHYSCSSLARHLCPYIDKFRYVLIDKRLFGGIVAFQKQQFKSINGFSNSYWGWGGEDDDLYLRLESTINEKAIFERYNSEAGRCTMLKHVHNHVESDDRFELLKNSKSRIFIDGLNTLQHIYTNLSIVYKRLFVHIKVHLIHSK